ncbi:MAG: PAS domain S-box protein, partial [Nitrospirota bacterium]
MKRPRILVVDDEEEIVNPLLEFLTASEYDAQGCMSGREAVDLLKKETFDLVVTDLMMPDMNGIDLLKSAFVIDPQLVGIVITGKGSVETAVDAMKAGAFDYLLKPLDWKMLLPVISRASEVSRLRRSEKKYRSIVEDQTELICRFLPDGTLTFVNEVYCRYFGKKPEELIGRSFMPLVQEEDRRMVIERYRSLTPENPAVASEHRVILSDGRMRWHQWTDRAIFDEDGTLLEIQSVGQDITDRKNAEIALQEAEEKYRVLIQTMNEGLGIQNAKGIVTYINDRFCDMVGYSKEEIIGKKVADFLDDRNKNILEEQMARRRTGEKRSYEIAWTKKNGELVYTLVSPRPMYDNDGRFIGSFGVLTDITDRKQAEESLKKSYEQVRALAARLTEVEEAERKELVRELHDQVGQNLTALGINLNILLDQISGKEIASVRQRIEDSLMLLEQTTERIRDLMANLRPSIMDDYGLMAVIRWYGGQFTR